jgi:hypothetical protein
MERQMNEDDVARLRRRIAGARRRATTAQLAPYVRAVDAARACGTRPRRRYWGDCYRRAAGYVLDRILRDGACPQLEGMTLVHGTCHDGHQLWAHAWVELPGAPGSSGAGLAADALVFCGVRQQFFDREGYRRVMRSTAEASYRPEELVDRLQRTQRFGPWHWGALGGSSVRRLDPYRGTGAARFRDARA